jgi:ribonuclease HI
MQRRNECEAQVKGFVGARYKKFSIAEEAEAFAGINVASSSQMQPQPPAKVTPSATTTATRTSPYKRPEPARNLTPVSPTATRATPSKRPSRVSSLSPHRSSPNKAAAKWNQCAASPNIADESTWDVAYTDGACRGNGKPGSVARAGIGVWWGPDDPRYASTPEFLWYSIIDGKTIPRNLAERCPGAQTNNRAELIVSDNNECVCFKLKYRVGYCSVTRNSTPKYATSANQN